MHFGVTERQMFHEWTYWQFRAYLRAAEDLLAPGAKAPDDGKVTTSDGRRVVDARNATPEQMRAMGIPVVVERR